MNDFDKIYELYGSQVYKYLICLTGSTELAEELTQETFYQAIKSIHRFKGECKLSVWLCQIAKFSYFKYKDKHMRLQTILDEISETITDNENPETITLEKEAKETLSKGIHSLDEPYKKVVYLRVYSSLSFKEIGSIFGNNEIWARVTFHRGKQKLMKLLNNKKRRLDYEDKL